jgi:diphosphomevalonate decarboxylase
MSRASARACANIALVKYWGKRNAELNLPAAGSLSLTLEALQTTAAVHFSTEYREDTLVLDGAQADATRLSRWLDIVREWAGISERALVESDNHFPTASGLASSASAYAALALAASKAAGLELSPGKASELARRGSGSAARSIFGGFARMDAGSRADGSDAIAHTIEAPSEWQPVMVIAVVGGGVRKAVSSRDAMEHCAATSPLYDAWVSCVDADLESAERAVRQGDIQHLGPVVEGSAMAMHAAALASRPAIRYWSPDTLRCLDSVLEVRGSGVPAFATMDAGPHVKVLTLAEHAITVRSALEALDGVSQVIVSAPGPGATCSDC